ncbi:MAG: hypothetical protein DSY53_02820 [Persephonella sp.]|nr:MAG: hypothetical protein DSY53_02820 [Persephonella sp.]
MNLDQFYRDFVIVGIYLFAFLLSFLFEKNLLLLFEKKLKEKKSSVLLLFSFISGFLFILGWTLNNFIEDNFIKDIFRNFVLFSTSIFLLRSIFNLFIESKFIRYLLYFLLTSDFLISILKINLMYINEKEYSKFLIYIEKFLIVNIIYLLFSKSLYLIKNKNLVKFLRFSVFVLLGIFLLNWELNIINLSFETLIGFILILSITAIYYYLNFLLPKLDNYFKNIFKEDDLKSLKINIKIFITAIYIAIIKEILSTFLKLNIIFSYLDNYFIIKSELISISIYSILKAILLGFILFSLLNVIKKAIKLQFLIKGMSIEGGSAEALVFNLGILFNIMVIMSFLGITWKIILPFAGTLGIGIGFGLQTIMNNYISGFILMFSKKLKVGDIVELPSLTVSTLGKNEENVFGVIEYIGVLSTIVKTTDGVDISIPNSEFLSSPTVNFSYKDPLVRMRIPIGVAYSSDPLTVKNILLSVAKNLQDEFNLRGFKLPEPKVWFVETGDSSLNFITAIWIDIRVNLNVFEIISKFYFEAWYKLKEAGIEIPFPQNDIWFRNKLKVILEKKGSIKEI